MGFLVAHKRVDFILWRLIGLGNDLSSELTPMTRRARKFKAIFSISFSFVGIFFSLSNFFRQLQLYHCDAKSDHLVVIALYRLVGFGILGSICLPYAYENDGILLINSDNILR